ncbi:hypothetical protein OUZ56_029492 [Daphnia magna]|uniref:Uncharacterized protein n=1 Tax=Daphnia magna TaxID=35525 RepID=A0ABR0B700_9CRUS|nr:hypothetical protein OUZ56_029492 [Daphnia magna]
MPYNGNQFENHTSEYVINKGRSAQEKFDASKDNLGVLLATDKQSVNFRINKSWIRNLRSKIAQLEKSIMEITSLVGLETFSLCKSDKRMKRY